MKLRAKDIPDIVAEITKLLGTIVRCAMWCIIAYYAYLAIMELAGKVTISDLDIDISADTLKSVNKVNAACVAFGIFGILYGLVQRMLRRQYIERMDTAIKERDKRLDPRKGSSGLNKNGTSRR